jgi:alpha-L-fucosidase
LGRSFGFNRAEGEAETISSKDLIYLLVDIVSKNGNLLLDVGPEADGAIPPVQLSRLQALGSWLQQNGEAIYGTTPWTRPSGTTTDGTDIRFTRKDTVLYAILPDRPKSSSITIQSFSLNPAAKITALGQAEPLSWSAQGSGTTVSLPPKLPGNYAFTLKIAGAGL